MFSAAARSSFRTFLVPVLTLAVLVGYGADARAHDFSNPSHAENDCQQIPGDYTVHAAAQVAGLQGHYVGGDDKVTRFNICIKGTDTKLNPYHDSFRVMIGKYTGPWSLEGGYGVNRFKSNGDGTYTQVTRDDDSADLFEQSLGIECVGDRDDVMCPANWRQVPRNILIYLEWDCGGGEGTDEPACPAGYSGTVRVQAHNIAADTTDPIDPDLENNDPTFNAGANATRRVAENTLAGQNVGTPVTARDADNDPLSYYLQGSESNAFSIVLTTGQLQTRLPLDFEMQSSYTFQVVVQDDRGADATTTVTVQVTDVVETATLTITGLQGGTVSENSPFTSTQPYAEDAIGTVTWTKEGADAGDFTIDSMTGVLTLPSQNYESPQDADRDNDYEVTVKATDADNNVGRHSITVTVTNTSELATLTISNYDTTSSVRENVAWTSKTPSVSGRHGAVTWTKSGVDSSEFTINENTGVLNLPAQDHETPRDSDSNNTYIVDVTAEDGDGNRVFHSVTVTVTNEIEKPSRPSAPSVSAVSGSTTELRVDWLEPTNTGPPITDYDVQYRVRGPGGFTDASYDGPGFTETLQMLTVGTEYEVQVRAVNSDGPGIWSPPGFGTTNASNNNTPIFNENAPVQRSIDENPTGAVNVGNPVTARDDDDDTLTYTLEGRDARSFDINMSDGQITTKSTVTYDHEAKSVYTVMVKVADDEANATREVTITIINVDEDGTVTLSPPQPREGTAQRATLNDPDGDVSGVTWTWAESADGISGWSTISGATSNSYTPVAANDGNYLRATADYTDGEGSNKRAEGISASAVRTAGSNNAPMFSSGETGMRSVMENAPGGVNVGDPVVATDTDDIGLRYSLSGSGAASFDIDNNGQIKTRSDASYDYETQSSYTVTVTARDPFNASDSIPVTITVIDVDEDGTLAFSSMQPKVGVELTATLTDPDGGVSGITWMWEKSPDGMNWSKIPDAAESSYTPVASDVNHHLQVTASYTDRHGSRKSAQAVTDNPVRASSSINDVNDELLPRITQAMMSSTLSAISRRVDMRNPNVDSEGPHEFGNKASLERALASLAIAKRGDTSLSLRRALAGKEFVLPFNTAKTGSGTVALWGRGDYRDLEGGDDRPTQWNGDLASVHVGIDWQVSPELLAGLAVSWSDGKFDYRNRGDATEGSYDSRLTSVHPYVSWMSSEDALQAWATIGYGRGEIEINDGSGERSSDTRLKTGAVGVSARITSVHNKFMFGTSTLRVKAEGNMTEIKADGGDGINPLTSDLERIRVVLEGRHVCERAPGEWLTPWVEVGARHDSGDGLTGTGMEVNTGVRYSDATRGLTMEGEARFLINHSDDYDEWGFHGEIRMDPGADGRGLSFSLAPSVGQHRSGIASLWSRDEPGVVPEGERQLVRSRLDAEIEYGAPALEGRGLLTPYVRLSLAGGDGDFRLGSRLEVGPTFSLNAEGGRFGNGEGSSDLGIGLFAEMRF